MQVLAGIIKENKDPQPSKIQGINIDIDDDYIELSSDSGDYAGFIEDNGKVTFSVIYDEDTLEEEGYPEGFNDDNWKNILGENHAFVKIINSIGGDIKTEDDMVSITVNASELY